MVIGGMESIKLSGNQQPPSAEDAVAEIKRQKSGGWSATVVGGLLFKETVPGTHNTMEAALEATVRFLSFSGRKKLFYRVDSGHRRVIKKTRYVRR